MAVLWLVLAMVLVSSANAIFRYLLNISSNAFLELQSVLLFAMVFLLCSGYTLKHNEHIRIDVVSSRFSTRTRMWIDVFGTVFFLLPMSLFIMWLSWPVFMNAWTSGEISSNAGGLIRLAGQAAGSARLLPAVAAGRVGADQAHRIPAGAHPGSGREARRAGSRDTQDR